MERATPILPADDLRAAKSFYVDRLGFGIRFEVSEDGKHGLLGLQRGRMYLTLDSPMSGHGRDACVALEVEDADAYYDEWRQRVHVLRPPKDEIWGARTFDLIDPFGNTIFVMGPPAGARMLISKIVTQLRTTDLAASIHFYTTRLGFSLAFQHEDFYAAVRAGNHLVHLKLVDEKDPSIEFVASRGHFHLYLETDDIATVAEAVKQRGVALVQDVHDTPWGTREFVIKDDQGHTLYFGQPASDRR